MPERAKMLSRTILTITVIVLAYPFANVEPQPVSSASNSASMSQADFYFPPGTMGGWAGIFAGFLERSGEPSLLASRDSALVTYRAESLSSDAQMLAVRLVVNPDGSGSIFLTEDSAPRHVLRKRQRSASVPDVQGILQRIEKAGFWSMPSTKSDETSNRVKTDTADGSMWVFEGIRHGSYHVVLRRIGSDYTPFDDMLGFLVKDLAGVKSSEIRSRQEH